MTVVPAPPRPEARATLNSAARREAIDAERHRIARELSGEPGGRGVRA